MIVGTLHPEVADRACAYCQVYFHNPQGETLENRDGTLMKRDGNCPPECETSKGCPKGTPENPRTHNERNQRCYEHYLECRAVGAFPDDPVVRRNAALIRDAEDYCNRILDARRQAVLVAAVAFRDKK